MQAGAGSWPDRPRHAGDSIAFCPPLIITEAEIAEMFARFGRALDETLTG